MEDCVEHLVGDEEEGHFFTIWGPRQSGKTWLRRRAAEEIRARYKDRFIVEGLSMQGVSLKEDAPAEAFLDEVPILFERALKRTVPRPKQWRDWSRLFMVNGGIFDLPLILLIDEFDKLPAHIVDQMVGLFRDMYLEREAYCLHGLALIGVRTVLGVESDRGSPFNIQRSMRVENLNKVEVNEMFAQYQLESGQVLEGCVRSEVFRVTRGQPGLVSWFGEMLTQKYNPGQAVSIGASQWADVLVSAVEVEANANVRNLVAKAREHASHVAALFSESDLRFSWEKEWCNFLYLNGIIDFEARRHAQHGKRHYCRFSSPFIQQRLFNVFTDDLFGARGPVLALKPGDALSDVFSSDALNLPPLMSRYQEYLERLNAEGIDPWKDAPPRADRNITESVGHFHLYAWLREAICDYAGVSPEFPTGNGLLDLVILYRDEKGVIEVKSFRNMLQLERGREQAARYAKKLGAEEVTVALFVHTRDQKELDQLSGETLVADVRIITVAIGWG